MGVEVLDNGNVDVDYISIRGKGDVIKSLKKRSKRKKKFSLHPTPIEKEKQ